MAISLRVLIRILKSGRQCHWEWNTLPDVALSCYWQLTRIVTVLELLLRMLVVK